MTIGEVRFVAPFFLDFSFFLGAVFLTVFFSAFFFADFPVFLDAGFATFLGLLFFLAWADERDEPNRDFPSFFKNSMVFFSFDDFLDLAADRND